MSTLIATEDGSLTCRHAETGELYHNRAGAYTEALQNYYRPSGAARILQTQGQLRLLDACFGLGYNSLVLLAELLTRDVPGEVSISGIDIDAKILALIPTVLRDSRFAALQKLFADHAPAGFGVWHGEVGGLKVNIELRNQDLRDFLRAENHPPLDLVFHDPFSPAKMPELWTVDIFRRYYQLLGTRGGKLLTYSSAFAVRGGLLQSQFHVFRTQSVGGKSGGTLATTRFPEQQSELVVELAEKEKAGILSRSGVPYRDPGLTHSRSEILAGRSQEQAGIAVRRPC
jgi:uncharacterized protein